MVLGVGNALQRDDVGVLGVLGDDADGLGGVHRGAATHGDDAVSAGSLEGLDAVLHVLDGGVGLDLLEELPSDASLVEEVGDLGGDAKLHEVGVRGDESLLEATALDLAGDLLDGALAVIRDVVQDETISHSALLSLVNARMSALCPTTVSAIAPFTDEHNRKLRRWG